MLRRAFGSVFRLEQREENRLADPSVGKEHHQPVDTQPQTPMGGQPNSKASRKSSSSCIASGSPAAAARIAW